MKKLSEFKDEKAIEITIRISTIAMQMIENARKQGLKEEEDSYKIFSKLFTSSPKLMLEIFALLSEEEPETYHCNGGEAARNFSQLLEDEDFTQLFLSQKQTGDATSSANALENTKE